MNDAYMEHMVQKKTTMKDHMLRALVILLIAVSAAASLFFPVMFLLALILAAAAYFLIFPATDLEYEYLYCDKQITIDKIMAKKSRKQVAVYDVDKMEILAPEGSSRLKEYEGRIEKELPLWSFDKEDGHVPYVMIYEGKQKVIMDLPEEFVKLVQNAAPRKVFFD